MITIFTPTYNRAYILPKLYESLCAQTCKDFEWLIVDDGSSDNTEELVQGWIDKSNIDIRYIRQVNGGKHRAINRGVSEAKGKLFFIVDSDDVLIPESISIIEEEYKKISSDRRFCGLAGSLATPQGHRIGGLMPFDYIDCSALDFRLKYKVKGDMAEVFRTSVLKEFPFPEIEGENFCPEALVWNRIASKYIMRFMAEPIYVTEYLPDGLTAKIVQIRRNSPRASMIYYSELFMSNISMPQKTKAAINFWRFASRPYHCKKYKMNSILSFISYPVGKIMRWRDE